MDISHQRSNSAKDHKEQMALQRKVERDRAVSEGADLALGVTPTPTEGDQGADSLAGKETSRPQLTDDSTSIDINITSETVAK